MATAITPVASAMDKLCNVASAGLTSRFLQAGRLNPHTALERAKQSGDRDAIERATGLVNTQDLLSHRGADEFRYASLAAIASSVFPVITTAPFSQLALVFVSPKVRLLNLWSLTTKLSSSTKLNHNMASNSS